MGFGPFLGFWGFGALGLWGFGALGLFPTRVASVYGEKVGRNNGQSSDSKVGLLWTGLRVSQSQPNHPQEAPKLATYKQWRTHNPKPTLDPPKVPLPPSTPSLPCQGCKSRAK